MLAQSQMESTDKGYRLDVPDEFEGNISMPQTRQLTS